jgi:hypothetical protein
MELTENPPTLTELDPLVPEYLEAEHIDRYDPGRHKRVQHDVHASKIGKCQRRMYWLHEIGKNPESSPYFPLGNMLEDFYGRALRERFGDKRVRQDVGCTIFLPAPGREGCIRIVGESDWVVFNQNAAGRGHVAVLPDGSRVARSSYDEEKEGYPTVEQAESWDEYDGCIDRVVETKTTTRLNYLDRYNRRGYDPVHLQQLTTYQHAFDAPGELTYVVRNDLEERRYSVPLDASVWGQVKARAMTQWSNRLSDTIPVTDTLNDQTGCEKMCPFVDKCKKVGGSQWDSK